MKFSNGVKYCRPGSSVHLAVQGAEAGWAAEVRDTGLSHDQQAHLY